jgi:hypothetical protein
VAFGSGGDIMKIGAKWQEKSFTVPTNAAQASREIRKHVCG